MGLDEKSPILHNQKQISYSTATYDADSNEFEESFNSSFKYFKGFTDGRVNTADQIIYECVDEVPY